MRGPRDAGAPAGEQDPAHGPAIARGGLRAHASTREGARLQVHPGGHLVRYRAHLRRDARERVPPRGGRRRGWRHAVRPMAADPRRRRGDPVQADQVRRRPGAGRGDPRRRRRRRARRRRVHRRRRHGPRGGRRHAEVRGPRAVRQAVRRVQGDLRRDQAPHPPAR